MLTMNTFVGLPVISPACPPLPNDPSAYLERAAADAKVFSDRVDRAQPKGVSQPPLRRASVSYEATQTAADKVLRELRQRLQQSANPNNQPLSGQDIENLLKRSLQASPQLLGTITRGAIESLKLCGWENQPPAVAASVRAARALKTAAAPEARLYCRFELQGKQYQALFDWNSLRAAAGAPTSSEPADSNKTIRAIKKPEPATAEELITPPVVDSALKPQSEIFSSFASTPSVAPQVTATLGSQADVKRITSFTDSSGRNSPGRDSSDSFKSLRMALRNRVSETCCAAREAIGAVGVRSNAETQSIDHDNIEKIQGDCHQDTTLSKRWQASKEFKYFLLGQRKSDAWRRPVARCTNTIMNQYREKKGLLPRDKLGLIGIDTFEALAEPVSARQIQQLFDLESRSGKRPFGKNETKLIQNFSQQLEEHQTVKQQFITGHSTSRLSLHGEAGTLRPAGEFASIPLTRHLKKGVRVATQTRRVSEISRARLAQLPGHGDIHTLNDESRLVLTHRLPSMIECLDKLWSHLERRTKPNSAAAISTASLRDFFYALRAYYVAQHRAINNYLEPKSHQNFKFNAPFAKTSELPPSHLLLLASSKFRALVLSPTINSQTMTNTRVAPGNKNLYENVVLSAMLDALGRHLHLPGESAEGTRKRAKALIEDQQLFDKELCQQIHLIDSSQFTVAPRNKRLFAEVNSAQAPTHEWGESTSDMLCYGRQIKHFEHSGKSHSFIALTDGPFSHQLLGGTLISQSLLADWLKFSMPRYRYSMVHQVAVLSIETPELTLSLQDAHQANALLNTLLTADALAPGCKADQLGKVWRTQALSQIHEFARAVQISCVRFIAQAHLIEDSGLEGVFKLSDFDALYAQIFSDALHVSSDLLRLATPDAQTALELRTDRQKAIERLSAINTIARVLAYHTLNHLKDRIEELHLAHDRPSATPEFLAIKSKLENLYGCGSDEEKAAYQTHVLSVFTSRLDTMAQFLEEWRRTIDPKNMAADDIGSLILLPVRPRSARYASANNQLSQLLQDPTWRDYPATSAGKLVYSIENFSESAKLLQEGCGEDAHLWRALVERLNKSYARAQAILDLLRRLLARHAGEMLQGNDYDAASNDDGRSNALMGLKRMIRPALSSDEFALLYGDDTQSRFGTRRVSFHQLLCQVNNALNNQLKSMEVEVDYLIKPASLEKVKDEIGLSHLRALHQTLIPFETREIMHPLKDLPWVEVNDLLDLIGLQINFVTTA